MIPRLAKTLGLVAAGAVVLGGAGLAAAGIGGGGGTAPARSTLPPATAAIERTTLTATQEVDGTLGYGDPRVINGLGKGTLTWLARAGATVTRGEPVYRADTHPIPLLYGSLPLYRTMRTGVQGPDVLQLERNLRALGYGGFTVDTTFGPATADAVERWQDDLGVEETGAVVPGSVVIARGPIRVAEHKKAAGDPVSGGPVLTCTGTTQSVTVKLDVGLRRLARKGTKAALTMPGGGSAQGTITGVGAVATRPSRDSDTSTIKVTISVGDQKALGGLDQAPVDVRLTADRHRDVLAVPVAALLALPGGRYGVQVVAGGTVRTVPVETGMFSEGKVEISGTGLREGMKVGIPA
ncbi:peptidoglycan-binding protein [Actinomadura scrupuli]|uniref:peptidoglycan-binding protein n=1 Tax=Actinomadura scrupuli TaxID=559629 RepID=UPI003D990A3F